MHDELLPGGRAEDALSSLLHLSVHHVLGSERPHEINLYVLKRSLLPRPHVRPVGISFQGLYALHLLELAIQELNNNRIGM